MDITTDLPRIRTDTPLAHTRLPIIIINTITTSTFGYFPPEFTKCSIPGRCLVSAHPYHPSTLCHPGACSTASTRDVEAGWAPLHGPYTLHKGK